MILIKKHFCSKKKESKAVVFSKHTYDRGTAFSSRFKNTFTFSYSNTIGLPLVYFWRGKEQWALVRILDACQNHPTALSCILHLSVSRPLERDNSMGMFFARLKGKRKFVWGFFFFNYYSYGLD